MGSFGRRQNGWTIYRRRFAAGLALGLAPLAGCEQIACRTARAGILSSAAPLTDSQRQHRPWILELRRQQVGEIPFEQPTRITLTLNRETAKSIGLAFSQLLLLRVDEVIA